MLLSVKGETPGDMDAFRDELDVLRTDLRIGTFMGRQNSGLPARVLQVP